MNKAVVKKFHRILEEQRNQLLYHDRVLREDFYVNSDDRFDEVDQATSDMEQSNRMRLRNREMLLMKKIVEALRRIEGGIFGLCEVCEEPIEMRRLEARPTATLCVGCKEDEERNESATASGRRHKSLGYTFSQRPGMPR